MREPAVAYAKKRSGSTSIQQYTSSKWLFFVLFLVLGLSVSSAEEQKKYLYTHNNLMLLTLTNKLKALQEIFLSFEQILFFNDLVNT